MIRETRRCIVRWQPLALVSGKLVTTTRAQGYEYSGAK
jgi:hypothetical protein